MHWFFSTVHVTFHVFGYSENCISWKREQSETTYSFQINVFVTYELVMFFCLSFDQIWNEAMILSSRE